MSDPVAELRGIVDPAAITPRELLMQAVAALDNWVEERESVDAVRPMHPEDAYSHVRLILDPIASLRIAQWQKNRPGPTSPTD